MVIGKTVNKKKVTKSYSLKPYTIPDGFQIVVDTREQKPYPLKDIPYFKSKVVNGDYTISGLEDYFAIERKQMGDFYSYIGAERVKKTEDKIQRFIDIRKRGGWVGLIVEVDEKDLFASSRTRHSNVSPEVARQFLSSWHVKYGLYQYLCSDRKMCERWMVDRMIKFYNLRKNI